MKSVVNIIKTKPRINEIDLQFVKFDMRDKIYNSGINLIRFEIDQVLSGFNFGLIFDKNSFEREA